MLPDAGFKAFVAGAGTYDAVVIDYKLPDFNGIELLRKIKLLKPGSTVVIMSGYIDDELRAIAYAEGAALVLSKTDDLNDFCVSLRTLLDGEPESEGGSFTDWSSL